MRMVDGVMRCDSCCYHYDSNHHEDRCCMCDNPHTENWWDE